MKNIHLIPTDKPSRLAISENKNLIFTLSPISWLKNRNKDFYNQNIYITNLEEIKEGDWYLNTLKDEVEKCEDIISQKNVNLSSWLKKIILTTDQDLIKKDVQAIDDEFLEWFVKNPSCEVVEVEKNIGRYVDYTGNIHSPISHKTIIPKEEPKLRSFCEAPDEKCTMNYCDENGCQNRKRVLVEPKKETETLEEAIDRISKEDGYDIEGGKVADFVDGMVKGAKWQQQRSYSGEEVNKLLDRLLENNMCSHAADELIEKFKNKNLNNPLVVSVSTLPPQYCKDCKSFPCDNYDKHLECKNCVFIGNQQSNFEPRSVFLQKN